MTPEQYLDKQIMLWCGERDWLCFHVNVGKVELKKGGFFQTGLPTGFPDLLIITDYGETMYCETKIKPRKPTTDQINFINNLKNRGSKAFVAYTLEEFIENVKK